MTSQWLQQLEDKVEAALSELTRLREENDSLRATVEKLRTEAKEESGESGWEAERDEVRERVGRLVETLESTLDDLG